MVVHIELVRDLSTRTFIAELERFISGRRSCNKIRCDNGRHFVGVVRDLNEIHKWALLNKEVISKICLPVPIELHFISPQKLHIWVCYGKLVLN